MRVRHGVEAFCITFKRHLAQPERNAAIDFLLPASVRGPVLMPPWSLHFPLVIKACIGKASPFYSLLHRLLLASFFRIAFVIN
jgi:hypothetical protein